MNEDTNKGTFDEDAAKARFESERKKAEETMKDKDTVRNIIAEVFEKLLHTTAQAVMLVRDDILLLLAVMSAYLTGRYRKIPIKSLGMILAALTYFLSPLDIILDFIPVIGFLDDVFIIGLTLKLCHDDLQEYKDWEATQTAEAAQGGQV